jgi:hypothetical protein
VQVFHLHSINKRLTAHAGNRAAGVAVLEGAAQPPADHPGGSAGADELPVAFEPDL